MMAVGELSAQRAELIRSFLVEIGHSMLDAPRRSEIHFSGDAEADAILNDLAESPHAFVFACLVDRQVPAEVAWKVPLRIKERAGSFDLHDLALLSEQDWVQVLRNPRPAHRFPGRMAVVLHRATARIVDRYSGNAACIWGDAPPSARLVRRFLEFHGAGPKIATMATNILVRDFRVHVADHRYIDISADVQVVRVMSRLGLISQGGGADEAIYAARELNPDFPGIFDLPLWELGRTICRPRAPRCDLCFLQTSCPSSEITDTSYRPERATT